MPDTLRTTTELLTSLFHDGQVNGSITPQDIRDLIVSVAHQHKHGIVDYNDLATATTQIVVPADVETKLTNDTLGPNTNISYLPMGVTSIWNTVTNQFDFTELSLGTMVNLRITIDVTTSSLNTDVNLDMKLGIGDGEYKIQFDRTSHKAVGTYSLSRFIGIYIGDTNTRDNPAEFVITTDNNTTVQVHGWYAGMVIR